MPCFAWCLKRRRKVHPAGNHGDTNSTAGRNPASPELSQVSADVDISCFPWCFKGKQRKKIHPAGRDTNTTNHELSQVPADVVDISCFPWCFKRKQRKKIHPAGRDTNTTNYELSQISATAVTETSTATTNIEETSEVSKEITSAAAKAEETSVATSNTVADIDIPTSITETPVTVEVTSETSIATEETTVVCVMTPVTTEGVNEVTWPVVQELDEKLSSATVDRSAEVQTLHGGDSPVCVVQVEREETRTEGPKTHTLTPARRKQLNNRGLMNFGNSCYVNASLQCLFSLERFCTQLSSQLCNWFYHPSAQLIRCFIELWWMRESSDWELKASVLMELIDAAASTNPEFTTSTQNDAHEFLFHCLSQMQEIGQTLGRAGGGASECPIRANFGFQLECILTCAGCGTQKSRKEEYNHLALALESRGSVKDCLNLFFSDEEEIECRCGVCGYRYASCRRAFHTLPRVLVLQLNRFQVSAASTKKQHKSIHIDPELQLTLPVQSCPEEHIKATPTDHLAPDTLPDEDRKAMEEKTERNELGESVYRYSLISVLNHVGRSIYSGHYLSDCCSKSDSSWLSCNDERVTITTVEKVLEQRQRSAYVFFYERT